MEPKKKTKSKKRRIELLTTCYGWERGYVTKILSHDDDHYYFNDEWGRFSTIEKDKEGVEFLIVGKEYKKDTQFMCGGKDVTYKTLMERVENLNNPKKEL